MELVYLWVEDYKNIHKQGFNFSPRFTCEYDDETNELTIDENDDYIENFFGDNINVTAIVGKNGSGKSSVLEYLYYSFHFHDATILIFQKDNNLFSITKKQLTYISTRQITTLDENTRELDNCIFPLFDYSFKRSFRIKSDLFPTYPPKYKTSKFDFIKEEYKTIKMILKNYLIIKQINKWNLFESYFQPKFIKVYTTKFFKNMEGDSNEIKREVIKELNKKSYEYFQAHEFQKGLNCLLQISKLPVNVENLNKNDLLKFIEKIDEVELTEELYRKNICQYQDFENEYKEENIEVNNFKFGIFTKEYENDKSIFMWDINTLTQSDIDLILEVFSFSFNIEISDNHFKYFNELSYGEQQLLIILNKIFEFFLNGNITNYLCSFDEIDIGFHPDWQKKIITFIIDYMKLIPEKKFHLLFTTHSPFLLSDIPKENIIFLGGNIPEKQTFGANIHTLLSDSFFMEDGLMGEFAKGKIQEIMDYLNDKKTIDEISTKEEQIKQVIESIGEPFLKDKLLKMYDVKYPKTKEEKIAELQKQIEALKDD